MSAKRVSYLPKPPVSYLPKPPVSYLTTPGTNHHNHDSSYHCPDCPFYDPEDGPIGSIEERKKMLRELDDDY